MGGPRNRQSKPDTTKTPDAGAGAAAPAPAPLEPEAMAEAVGSHTRALRDVRGQVFSLASDPSHRKDAELVMAVDLADHVLGDRLDRKAKVAHHALNVAAGQSKRRFQLAAGEATRHVNHAIKAVGEIAGLAEGARTELARRAEARAQAEAVEARRRSREAGEGDSDHAAEGAAEEDPGEAGGAAASGAANTRLGSGETAKNTIAPATPPATTPTAPAAPLETAAPGAPLTLDG